MPDIAKVSVNSSSYNISDDIARQMLIDTLSANSGIVTISSTTSSTTSWDTTKIVVYKGTTSGNIRNGHFYYYDGSNWIDGGVYSLASTKIWYGTCSTQESVAAKVVNCSNFILENGAIIIIYFTYENSVETPTLNVNGTGAKLIASPIYGNHPTFPAGNHMFQYDSVRDNYFYVGSPSQENFTTAYKAAIDTTLPNQITNLNEALNALGLVDYSYMLSESINKTTDSNTEEVVRLFGDFEEGKTYSINIQFNSVTWRTNKYIRINSYSENNISGTYLVDAIRNENDPVTGALNIQYTPTADAVMIAFTFYLGTGVQNIQISVSEIISPAIENLEDEIYPVVDLNQNEFSGTVASSPFSMIIPYHFYKGNKYKLIFNCVAGTESVGNVLRVHTASAGSTSGTYQQDIINAGLSSNPLCGKIDEFATGDIIEEEFTATKDASYLIVLYYGTVSTAYNIKIDVGRIASLEQVDNILLGNGVVALNKDVEPYVLQFKREISTQTQNHNYDRLNFIFFSDIHARLEQWERICDYMDYYPDIIPFAIHGGDYVSTNLAPDSIVDLYGDRKPKNGAILNTVGNHDCTPAGSTQPTANAETVYGVLYESVNPVTDGWACTFGSAQYAMYWYKDIAEAGIRIVCVDQYHWDSNQATFVSNALSEAITLGYGVVTVTHTPITTSVDDIGSGFWTLDDWIVGDTYAGAMVEIRAAINTFITNGGNHIVNLCGHIHSDQIGELTDDGIFQIRTQMAGYSETWTDTYRVVGTKTFDCFNVIQIDRNLQMVKLVRIGCNTSDCLQPRTTLCYDYANKKLICNN